MSRRVLQLRRLDETGGTVMADESNERAIELAGPQRHGPRSVRTSMVGLGSGLGRVAVIGVAIAVPGSYEHVDQPTAGDEAVTTTSIEVEVNEPVRAISSAGNEAATTPTSAVVVEHEHDSASLSAGEHDHGGNPEHT